MSRRTTSVYLPCDTFDVEALVGPSDVASPIERLVLRLVGEGIENLRDLDGLVGLGPRPTLDLVCGLWRRGHLSLDPGTGRIAVTAAVRDAIRNGRLDTLAGGELSTVRVTLMQDLVSGTVVAAEPTPFAPSPYRIVPPLMAAGSFRRASPTSFQVPLERAVRRLNRFSGGRELKVFQASLPLATGPGDTASSARRFLRVEVACSRDPDSGRLAARVVFPAWLPLTAQTSISAGLTKVAERYPRHAAVQKLWEEAETEATPPPTRPSALAEMLVRVADDLDRAPEDERFDRHAELVTLSEVATGLLGTEADAAQRLVPLVGAPEIDEAVARVIKGASRQLVLVCPWVRPAAFQRWYRLLQAQLEAQPDLHIFLLWGISPSSLMPTDGPLAEWLEALRRSGRVRLSQRSSNTHAKIAVADATHAVVASFNYLSATPSGVLEVGVEASATAPERLPSPIALELLRCALDMCPEHAMALELMTEPGQWGLPHPTESGAKVLLPLLPEDVEDAEEYTKEDAWTRRARWQLWVREWQGRAVELADALREHARPASVVRDGEHQQALWNELREAERRLVITSDQATHEVVTARLLDALLARGADRRTALVYGRATDALHETIAAHCTPASGATVLRRAASVDGNHAKVLLADDRAVVTSYNFLSFDGDYEGEGRYEMRTELGVLLRDRAAVAELTGKLARAVPDLAPVLAHGSTAASAPPPMAGAHAGLSADDGARLHGLLTALRQTAGPAERREALRGWVLGGPPWSGLRVLEELGFEGMQELVPLALREHEHEFDSDWRHWLFWWAERAWHDERTPIRTVAALSRLGHEVWTARLPPATVVRLQWEILVEPPAAAAFDELVLGHSSALAEGPASGILALGLQLLLQGAAVEDACGIVAERARPPLAAWLKDLSRFRDVEWQRPVPMDAVRARTSSQEQHQTSEKAREAARKEIEEAGREGLWDFMKGRETRPFLFDDARPFGQLRKALDGSDVQAVRSWLRHHHDLERLLDDATHAGLVALRSELAGEDIVEPRRTACLRRLRGPILAVKAWLATNPQQPLSSEDLWLPTLELARSLRVSAGSVLAARLEGGERPRRRGPHPRRARSSDRAAVEAGDVTTMAGFRPSVLLKDPALAGVAGLRVAAVRGEADVDDRRLLHALLDFDASGRSPLASFDSLVENGEFSAAEKLLEGLSHGAARAAEAELRPREKQLAAARTEVLREVAEQARFEVERVRALGADVPSAIDRTASDVTDAARQSREVATVRLGDLRRLVEQRVATQRDALRARVAVLEAQGSRADLAARARAALERDHLDVVQALLEEPTPTDEPTLDALSVPRPRAWVENTSLQRALEWLTSASAPPGFLDRWRPAAGDADAWEMVGALRALFDAWPPSPDSFHRFAVALDRLLGGTGDLERPAAVEGALSVRVPALTNSDMPWFRPTAQPGGLLLILPAVSSAGCRRASAPRSPCSRSGSARRCRSIVARSASRAPS
jgi:hypothetical protein